MTPHLLKIKIECFYQHMRTTNPLFLNAKNGKLGPKHIVKYLSNIHFLVAHTPIHLHQALERSKLSGQEDLSNYYEKKIPEEQGHDQWAIDGLSKLNENQGLSLFKNILPTMKKLVEYNQKMIQKDPLSYLSYIFFSEYFTVLGAEEWLNDLEIKCGIPKSMMSIIGNHATLDKDHIQEDLKILKKITENNPSTAQAHTKSLIHELETSMLNFEHFCTEVGALAA